MRVRRLFNEVDHRPLVTVAVAVGVGILVGLAHEPHAELAGDEWPQ
jgi:hypothetical protein